MAKRAEVISISDSQSSEASIVFNISPVDINLDSRRLQEKQKPHNDTCSVAVITVSSEEGALKEPITKNTLKCLKKTSIQSPKTKVRAWLNENYESMVREVESSQREQSLIKTGNHGILVRRDYNKINNTNRFNTENTIQTQIQQQPECSNAKGNSRSNNSVITATTSLKEKSLIVEEEVLSNNEMQQKIELYKYLKLMDKKRPCKTTSKSAENRRSSRVKNLVLLNEKRALEKERHKEIIVHHSSTESKKSKAFKDFSDSGNSKDSKQFSRRSFSVESSVIRSSREMIPKASKITSRSLRLGSNSSNSESNVNRRTDTIMLNIESLQVPEVTSTSIPFNNTKLQHISSLHTKRQKLVANKSRDSVEKSDNNCKSNTSNVSKEPLLNTTKVTNPVKTNSSASNILISTVPKKCSIDMVTITESIQNQAKEQKHIQTQGSAKIKLRKIDKLIRKQKIVTARSHFDIIKRKKHFGSPQRLNRLRSSGKLKMLPLKSILLKSKKRKLVKKKVNDKVNKRLALKLKNKPFVRSELIQSGHKTNNTAGDLKLYDPNFLFNVLTPEHRLALIESKRFLDITLSPKSPEAAENIKCIGFNSTEVSISMNNLEKIKSVVVYLDECFDKRQQNKIQYTSEDLEVSQLMERLIDKKFAPKVHCALLEGSSDGKRSLTGEGIQCTSSYPRSSGSFLITASSERETNTDIVNNIEVLDCVSASVEDLQMRTSPEAEDKQETYSVSQVLPNDCEFQEICVTDKTVTKTLSECLSKQLLRQIDSCTTQNWSDKKSALSHTVSISKKNGDTIGVYYIDFNLIVVQKLTVSFWSQTPLGNVLGAQDMWVPRGSTERLILEKGCARKESSEVVSSLLDSVAYIELWTKEHKSDKRERPVADIFIAIYLTSTRGGCLKKVLQLENIHGFASDVQYIVLRNSRNVIVSWNIINEDVSSTLVHCYELSLDYQTVQSIKEVQSVNHYVSSLHNIEDCDNIILGCGDQKITLWNFENLDCCYIIATIDLLDIPPLRTLWAKCDRGFLFTLHELNNGVIQLIAINSSASTWKRLRTFNKPETEYDRLTGISIENGLIVACYNTGLLCWNARTADLLLESQNSNPVFLTFGGHVVIVLNDEVHIRHSLEYIISMEDV